MPGGGTPRGRQRPMRLLVTAALGCALSTPPVRPAGQTAAVPHDPDDPAIWIHPTDPARSLILGTDKIESTGGLYVFGLDGTLESSSDDEVVVSTDEGRHRVTRSVAETVSVLAGTSPMRWSVAICAGAAGTAVPALL